MKASKGYLFLMLLVACIWGFAFVAQVEGTAHVQPFTLTGVRFLIGIIALLPVVLSFERGRADAVERKRTVVASLITGAILFTASILQQYGIQMTGSAGISGFITGLYTVLVPVACYIFFKKKTTVTTWIGVVLAITGLFMLCYRVGEGLHFGIGELLLLIGALFWTAHVVVIDRLGKNIRSLHYAWGQFAVCAVLGLIAMLAFEQPSLEGIVAAKWSLLYCGLLSSGVAYTLQVIAQKKTDPALAAIVLSTESCFSAIGGKLFGIDEISILGYIGCAVIFAGIVISQINIKDKSSL